MSDRARVAMQGYLNHFLSNIDIVNSQEVRLINSSLFVFLSRRSMVNLNVFFREDFLHLLLRDTKLVSDWGLQGFNTMVGSGDAQTMNYESLFSFLLKPWVVD